MKITINAFATLNLSLDIKDLLPNGYHIIETVFQSISLHDTITVENGVSKTEVICNKGGITPENNICFKALNIFMDTAANRCPKRKTPRTRLQIKRGHILLNLSTPCKRLISALVLPFRKRQITIK